MSLDILNIDDLVKTQFPTPDNIRMNDVLSPQHDAERGSFRMLISGRSGCGKTNLVLSLIFQGQITWDHIYLYVKSPDQPKYQLLLRFLNSLQDAYEAQYKRPIALYTLITQVDEILPVDEIPSNRCNLVIFDDLLTVKDQKPIEEYFIRGRHRRCDCIYISQSYHSTPIIIRKNCDYFAIFSPSSKGEFDVLKKEHRPVNDSTTLFADMFQSATKDPNSFLLIDKRTQIELLKYRKNFNHYYNPDEKSWIKIVLD